jgi:hypothetical protein
MHLVEVSHSKTSIIVIMRLDQTPPIREPYTDPWLEINSSLRNICGDITMPNDNGQAIINHAISTNSTLFCASDGLVQHGNRTHAWVITTSDPAHLKDPLMRINGSGAVDGHTSDMSSGRMELQGQTALAIMLNHLQTTVQRPLPPCHFYCDNQAIISGCKHKLYTRLGHHKKPNMDLYMELKKQAQSLTIVHEWVKSHQDNGMKWSSPDELSNLPLDHEAKLNCLCDHLATESQSTNISFPDMEVLPAERWAVYMTQPTSKKVTGHLNQAVKEALRYKNMLQYIQKKHGLTEALLDKIEAKALGTYLRSIPVHKRTTIIKIIHGWLPTHSFLH